MVTWHFFHQDDTSVYYFSLIWHKCIAEAVRSSLAEEVIADDADQSQKSLDSEVLHQPLSNNVAQRDPDSDGNK